MTEITANIVARKEIDQRAFIGALISAPLVFTTPFFIVTMIIAGLELPAAPILMIVVIPVFALVLGYVYLPIVGARPNDARLGGAWRDYTKRRMPFTAT